MDEVFVVGVGASATGIRALKQFVRHVPTDGGAAYVAVLHLSSEYGSELHEVLQGDCPLPVTQVRTSTRIERNNVYVVPSNQGLTIVDGSLTPQPVLRHEDSRAPLDRFFRTLAEARGSRAACVVLSGTGCDGAVGLKRIKERGGLCIVQRPDDAEHPEMPRSAIATGLVDAVLPVEFIPHRITSYTRTLDAMQRPESAKRRESDERAIRHIFSQLRERTGHDFINYKRTTVRRQLERRMAVHDLPDLATYAHYLRSAPEETRSLVNNLLISVTSFFRDRETFDAIERLVIPHVFGGKTAEHHVRVWVAGCATGEEAYSIAMLLAERSSAAPDGPTVRVFATDVDEPALAVAREAIYSAHDVAEVAPARLRRFFVKEGDRFRVTHELREMVLFARHDALKDPPFSDLDLVSCRNLLIYLNRDAQQRVLELLHSGLRPGGCLVLGAAESVHVGGNLFVPFGKTGNIFESREAPLRPLAPPPAVLSVVSRAAVQGPHREKLETREEELQSVNEELRTVNQKLEAKLEEQTLGRNDVHNLINATQVAAVFLDPSARIKFFTPAAGDILNLNASCRGRRLTEFDGPLQYAELQADVDRVQQLLERVQRDVRTQDDRCYLIQIVPYRTLDDRTDGVVLTFSNVTQQRMSEARILRSESHLRSLLESITDHAVITVDDQSTIEEWNVGAERAFGFSASEAIGQSAAIIFTPEDRARHAHLEEIQIAQRCGRAADERWHQRKDGTRFYVSGVLTPIGPPPAKRFVKVARDLTERKQTEEALRESHDALEGAVELRTGELRQLLNRLITVQEDERRRIARDLHDDIGQKMTALHLKLEALRRAAERAPALEAQVQDAQRSLQQLDRDLDFFTWELRPAALYDLGLSQALRDFISEWSKNYELAATFQEVGMSGERLRLDQEINLYRIAQEALHNVHKHARATAVDVTLQRLNDMVVLTIEDDGVGIGGAAAGDRGMGLVNMRERAALMGGVVEFERPPAGGTTVIVRAPAVTGSTSSYTAEV